ncbi:D-mannitol 1-phosphate 5-dehydrogenase [Amphibacillus marinus]|uniref:Mannitol-1-phosphate 5-dehydrogenase n=1 Tax=Amphibacillus marinus TaxID=872970 RepID=A0A1H8KCX0_9BACI|nr:mannitol-1-phosphate 5-dehydrogenase [Amphibacillus marinus]SEN90764.1 D-mannitol 1-phosphate 5-dehydrogenase [Amphibacillus marinus]
MKAVHFGAGNIGRGFIGMLLYRAGYHTVFVDVNEKVINEINQKQKYTVTLADEAQQQEVIENISGINSIKDPDAVIEAIVEADVITTAVGAGILPLIADVIAKGLLKRFENNQTPVNVIACENMIGGSDLLKQHVLERIPEIQRPAVEALVGFPNAAVDRIVPNQSHEELLTVSVEPYYEWVVDEQGIKGEKPDVKGITYVSDLAPFIERKLFTVNTGHAVAAYLGYYLGLDTVKEAMDSPPVLDIVKGALSETGRVIVKQFGFDQAEHEAYIEKIIGRFLNPHISDELTRVARGPLRKLGKNDRFIRPATLYLDLFGEAPPYLAKAIAAAVSYDFVEDQEAKELQWSVKENGYQKALALVTELDVEHPVIKAALAQLEVLKELK